MRYRIKWLQAVLFGACIVFAQSVSIQQMKPERVLTLGGKTHHVQGLLVTGDRAYVTAVDRAAQKGYLFEYDLKTGGRLRTVEVQRGARFHPGGFDGDGESLWIPVAEYRPGSSTVIERRSKKSLDLISSFEVADHIGALAVAPGKLYAANWDARKLIEFGLDGKILRSRDNPTALRIQDWKYRHGILVASAVTPDGVKGAAAVWLDPETLRVLKTVPAGVTDRGAPFSREGLDSEDGVLYLLPEDDASRVFEFDEQQLAPSRRSTRPGS